MFRALLGFVLNSQYVKLKEEGEPSAEAVLLGVDPRAVVPSTGAE